MKKKWKVLSLLVAVAAFSTLSLTASYASDYQSVGTKAVANSVKVNDISVRDKAVLVAGAPKMVFFSQAQVAGKIPVEVDGSGSLGDLIFDK